MFTPSEGERESENFLWCLPFILWSVSFSLPLLLGVNKSLRLIYFGAKVMSLQTGSWIIQFSVYIKDQQRSKKKSLLQKNREDNGYWANKQITKQDSIPVGCYHPLVSVSVATARFDSGGGGNHHQMSLTGGGYPRGVGVPYLSHDACDIPTPEENGRHLWKHYLRGQ